MVKQSLRESFRQEICELVCQQPPNKNHLILFISHISMSLTESRKKVKIEHSLLSKLDRFQSYWGWRGYFNATPRERTAAQDSL